MEEKVGPGLKTRPTGHVFCEAQRSPLTRYSVLSMRVKVYT